MSWDEQTYDDKGKLSTQAMIFNMASNLWTRWFLPKWAYWFGNKKLKRIDEAYTAFVPFMRHRIAEREAALKKLRASDTQSETDGADLIKDVFGRLVDAKLSEGKLALSDDELIGNSFVFVSLLSLYSRTC